MSELDFDELDKAVNNLMSGVPKVEPPKNDDVKTLDLDSTLPADSRPSLDKLNSALTAVNGPAKSDDASAKPATPAAGSLATRRSGRFMDVVHPSSDMKNASKPLASRQGATIEPATKNLEQSEVSTPASAPEEPAEIPAIIEAEAESTPSTADTPVDAPSQNEWPDPLEMSGYQPQEEPVAAEEKTEAPVEPADDDDDAVFAIDDLEDTTPEPLTSPFITDAKVEKRPLGSPAADQTPVVEPVPIAPIESSDAAIDVDADDQLPATSADVAPILPPELQKDLMVIETDGDTSTSANEPSEVAAAEPATESQEAPVEPTNNEPEPEKDKPETEIPTPAGPASIPQQYKEEPSTGDQTNGGIYDTNNYHQPLAHPVKKKSGWLWIVWILLLLIIGGGGAAVLYLFNII